MKKHEHIYSIDAYAYQSDLKKYSPGWKLLFSLLVLFFCLWANHMAVSVYIFVTMGVINRLKNKISWQDFVQLLKIPSIFIILACVAIAFEISSHNGTISVSMTKESAYESLAIMLRTFAAVNTLYFLALSTPIYHIIFVLQKIHIPKVLTELMLTIYRYIFILMQTQIHMKNAVESRLGYVDFKTACFSFSNTMASLLIVSFQKANKYYDAMISRCYQGELLFLEEKSICSMPLLIGAVLYGISIILVYFVFC